MGIAKVVRALAVAKWFTKSTSAFFTRPLGAAAEAVGGPRSSRTVFLIRNNVPVLCRRSYRIRCRHIQRRSSSKKSRHQIFNSASRIYVMRSCENRFVPSLDQVLSEVAEIPFDNILDLVTGSDPSVTDYVLEQPAKCPNCRQGRHAKK
jgi:hypothetical protein